MRVLVSWLRDFVAVTASPEELAERLGLRGFEVASVEPAPDGVRPPWAQMAAGLDGVIDFEVTANRPDCLSVLGFAREVSTLYNLPLRLVTPVTAARVPNVEVSLPVVAVTIEDAERCPRYAAAMTAVTATTSPRWMVARLEAAGVRAISPFVDITNYVLMELGHPMHAFDFAKLSGGRIRVRRATPGETMTTLDGVKRELDTEMLVIADADRAQAVAGVMGGGSSEVSAATRVVVFESAYFQPASVRRTSKRLQLKTEASSRFERGVDIHAPVVALERALELTELIGAGRRGAVVDRYPSPRSPRTIVLRGARIGLILGLTIPDADVERILGSLGLALTRRADGWNVEVPAFRVDLLREIDLIEEVGRHHGFERLEPTFPPMSMAAAPADPRISRDRAIRTTLAAAGLTEAVTFGFIQSATARRFLRADDATQLVTIANPLTALFDVLRPSIVPGLLDVLAHNRRHGRRDVAIFEIGARFTIAHGERRAVGLAWTGAASTEHWSGSGREVDFFDVKGAIERLCDMLRVPVHWTPTAAPYLTAGESAAIMAGDSVIGIAGLMVPKIVDEHGAPKQDDVFVAELDLEALEAARASGVARETMGGADETVRPLPRFPFVVRDLSIVVSEALSADTIRGTIQTAAEGAPAPLASIAFFDRYKGKGVAEDCVSLSVRLTFQSAERTLTDVDVQQSFDRVRAALVQTHGAVQR
ncbi:MAG: phenylalanine--tRNA ligase subunit beta [Acidimicrobiia bacterium]|nr:phenylalanine--tRNA ligase subunit beta [Acidimicrobiia bacterium]